MISALPIINMTTGLVLQLLTPVCYHCIVYFSMWALEWGECSSDWAVGHKRAKCLKNTKVNSILELKSAILSRKHSGNHYYTEVKLYQTLYYLK